MSNRFHSKLHKHNHHSKPTDGYPDSSYDPIASYESPFQGDFYADGNIITTENLSAQKTLFAQNIVLHGGLTVKGSSAQFDTTVEITSSVKIINGGTDTALSVSQYGNQPIVNFLLNDQTVLYVDGKSLTPGYVGINTDTPNERLTVNGNISASGNLTVDGVVRVQTLPLGTTNSVITKSYIDNALESREINSAVWDVNFKFLSGENLISNFLTKSINDNGLSTSIIYDDGINVGIGTDSLSGKLTVSGDVTVQGELIIDTPNVGITNDVITRADSGALESRQINSLVWDLNVLPLTSVGTSNFVPKFENDGVLSNSVIYQDLLTKKIGLNTSQPNKELTVVGDISSTNTIYANGGNSDIWNTIQNKLNNNSNIPVSRVGDSTYLDIDIKGDFKGSQSTDKSRSYLLQERDGLFVGLRGGYNGITKKLFYFTSLDENLTNCNITDIEYRPSFLLATEYITELIDATKDGLLVNVKNINTVSNKVYWIHHKGTLNQTSHTFNDTVDVTPIVQTYSLQSIIYVPEKNIYIGTAIDGSVVKYYAFDSSLSLVSNGGEAWQQIDFNNASHVTFGVHSSSSMTRPPIINHTQTPNLQYFVDGDVMFVSQLVSIILFYPTRVLYVAYNSVCQYSLIAHSFGDFYFKPYLLDPDDSNTHSCPFFSKDSSDFFSWKNAANTKLYNINNFVYEAIKEISVRTSDFNFKKHQLITNWADVVLRPYDRRVAPPLPAVWSTDFVTLVPTDASLLGKTVTGVGFISPTRIYSFSESKQYGEPSATYKSIVSEVSDLTITNYHLTNGVQLSGLKTPTDVFLCPESIKPTHNYSQIKNNSDDVYFSTIVYPSGAMRVRSFDIVNKTFNEINGDDFTSSMLEELPSNYVDLINDIITNDVVSSGAVFEKQAWTLYHLKNGLYLLTFGCFFANFGVKSYFKILTKSGNIFISASLSILANTIQSIDGIQVGVDASNSTQHEMSSGIYDDGVSSLYVLFKCVGAETTGTNRQFCTIAHIDYIANTIIEWKSLPNVVNGEFNGISETSWPTWHKGICGIHPTYGPYYTDGMFDEYSKARMFYVDNSNIVGIGERITGCFNALMAGTDIQNGSLIVLTIRPAIGFILYVSSTSVFIKGGQYELPTQNIDLLNVVSGGNVLNVQNKTFYVFVELVGTTVGLTFSINRYTDTDSLIYVGSVTTDDIGISSSNFSKVSRLGNLQIEDKITTTGSTSATNEFIKVVVNGQTKYLRLFDI